MNLVLLVVKILKSHRDFVFSFLVKDHFEGACVVVDFKQGAHRLFLLRDHAAYNYNVVYGFSVNFAHIVRAGRGLLNHFHGHRREDSVFASLAAVLVLVLISSCVVRAEAVDIARHEKAILVVSELQSHLSLP